MNKKLVAIGMIAIMLATVFVGCKKGENDPALSLLSRIARITGTWQMTSGEWTTNYQYIDSDYGYNSTTTYEVDDDSWTRTYTYMPTGEFAGDNYTDITTYTVEYEMTIEKDGTFKMEEKDTYNFDGSIYFETTKEEGVWYFAGANKDLDVKNKERVIFQVEKYTSIDSDGDTYTRNYEGRSQNGDYLLLLDKLAKDEMVAVMETSWSDTDENSETTGTQTMVKLD
ncbi:MAG: hypothetical protein JXL97_00760 [Bacteroidales bacterium]|nr:hypothetical protein [Bacteroidales bacterium]